MKIYIPIFLVLCYYLNQANFMQYFVLAKSMYETNGIFWAWPIHFVQDILIIGKMFLMSSVKS
jgi:hypothetical protein